jgi:hypothetical protein
MGASSESQWMESQSKVTLRSVSKRRPHNSYKIGWPRKLFIYSNKHDDEQYSNYVQQLKQCQFDDALFIEQIEEYVRFLTDKGD